MSRIIENLNWRSVIKRYDATKKISDKDIEILKEAIRLSPTSYGLQLFKVLIIQNPGLRKKLQEASFGQTSVVDASHFIVFANYTKVEQEHIDEYFENLMHARNRTKEEEANYKATISGIVSSLGEYQPVWTAKQTYLVLGALLYAAADLRIDITPMEGFDPKKYNEILGLNDQNLNASIVAALGYRHPEDFWSPLPKVRKQTKELFTVL